MSLFEGLRDRCRRLPRWLVVVLAALAWLVLISGLHYWLNFDREQRQVVRMGYMPVVTNLACPLLDESSKSSGEVRFEALKFSSFAEMGDALRNGHIEAAFMIAPLAIVLHQQGAGIKVIYVGNRHESTLVTRRDLGIRSFAELAGRAIAVPMRFSGHNLALRRLAVEHGLSGAQLQVVEMNPPDMAAALATGSLDAYFVGEPFAAQTVRSGDAEVMYYVEEVWPGFICNLVVVRDDFIEQQPETVAQLVRTAARSGLWARRNPAAAAGIAAKYWNQPPDLVEYALTTPKDRIVFNRFIPLGEELQELAGEMVRFGLLASEDVAGLVDDRFARAAGLEGIEDFDSVATELNPRER